MEIRDVRAARLLSLALLLLCVAPSFLTAIPGNATPQRLDMRERAILDRASRYVATYQDQLTYVLADETSTQRVLDARLQMTSSRVTKSEVFFVVTPREGEWIAVRQVLEVDGTPVTDRRDMRAVLRSDTVANVAATLKQDNSRYNIGHVIRNFNEPTLALRVVNDRLRARFKFSRTALDTIDNATIATLAFKETDRPTLIRGLDGRDVYSTGDLVVEAATGRVRQTHLTVKSGTLRVEHTTTYEPDEKLGMWVPTGFLERYEQTAKEAPEVVLCETTYSNYRRFEVIVKIR